MNVASHAGFDRLRHRRVDGHAAKFAATSVEHTFLHNGGGGEIDLVPFGALGIPPGSLTWPVSGRVMSTTGLAATVAGSTPLPAAPTSGLRVASLPVLVALKLFAYEDRGSTRTDMCDAGALLEHAHDMFDLGVIDDELAELLVNETLTVTNVAAFDLGRMPRVLLEEPARLRALAILARAVDADSGIVTDMLQPHRREERHREDALARLEALHRALT